MKAFQIEAWVLRVVDQVRRMQPREDSRVELKAEWPEPVKAARQIAGHANAAGGEPILWIIGLDESRGVIGADETEMANWLPQVNKCFNEVSPHVSDLNVPIDDKTVVALVFSTERSPFVVKNPAFNNPDCGPVELEVPWREGRRTRSAKRADLLRILAPTVRLPSLELLGARVEVTQPSPNSQTSYNWNIAVRLYIAPHDRERVVIPCHRCEMRVGRPELVIMDGIWLEPRIGPGNDRSRVDSITVACTKSEAVVDGPGVLTVKACAQTPASKMPAESDTDMMLKVTPAGTDKPIIVEQRLQRQQLSGSTGTLVRWSFGKPE